MPKTVTDANREKFEELASNSDGVLVINDDMNIVFADSKLRKFLGFDEGDLLDEPLNPLLPRGVREKHPGWVKDFKDTGALKGNMATTPISAYDKDGMLHDMRGLPCVVDGFAAVAICNPEIRVAEVQAYVDAIKD